LRNALRPDDPKSVTDQDMIDFKRDVIGLVAPAASAVLLDPEFGIAQSIKSRDLPGQVGLLVTLEETGYSGDPNSRSSKILPGWNPAKARRMGANAIKLLVYYHPDASTAGEIEQLVGDVAEQCRQQDIPFFLEPLSYSLDPKEKKLTPKDRRRVVIETARKLTPLGADVLKAEFPLDIADEVNEEAWGKACAELSAASTIPWVLLSASVSYEIYLRQVAVACWKGASGVAVGRAVWQEAVTMSGEVRKHFLQNKVFERMQRVTALCNALARPWTDFYTIAEPTTTWYQNYASDLDR